MKILYIWDKAEIPLARQACVKGTLSLYPDAEVYCITKAKIFPGMKVIPWEEMLGKMKAFLGLKRTPYAWHNPICFSDWARFFFLAHNPNTLYLDTDCRLKARFDFETHAGAVHAGIFLLYAHYDGLPLLRMLKDRASQRVNLLNDFGDKLGWEALPSFWYQHG